MSSFRQLHAAHPVLLLIDSASSRIQVGFWPGVGAMPLWCSSKEDAGTGLFACAGELLENARMRISDVTGFVFCAGPGSVLGVRTAAMALRVWRVLNPVPIYAYHSLDLVAHALGDPAISVIADARRDMWHVARLGATLGRLSTAGLAGALLMPETFRHWKPLPDGVSRTPYDLATLLPRAADADLFQPAPEPDSFLHAEPDYATWNAQVHQAPVTP